MNNRNVASSGAEWVAVACLLATGALLGLPTNMAKLAGMHGLGALPFLAWSLVVGALICGATAAVRHKRPPLNRRTAEYFVVSALLSVAGPQLLSFSALPHVGASFVPLAIALPPLFIYLAVLMLGMQKFAIVRAAGVAFALFGAGFLASMKLDTPVAKTRWIDVSLRGVVGALVCVPVAIFLMGEAAPAGLLAGGTLIAVGVFLLTRGGPAAAPSKKASFAVARNAQRP